MKKSKPVDGPEDVEAVPSSSFTEFPDPSCTAAGALVAPKSIWPIQDPASPAAKPDSMGFRWKKEGRAAGGAAGVGGAPGPGVFLVAVADPGDAAGRSIGLKPFFSKVRLPRLPTLLDDMLPPCEKPRPPRKPLPAFAKLKTGLPKSETATVSAINPILLSFIHSPSYYDLAATRNFHSTWAMATITITTIHAITQARYKLSTMMPKPFFTVIPRVLPGRDPILERILYRLGYQNGVKSTQGVSFGIMPTFPQRRPT
jgi:hypothetical protein